jgi:hypothetical protein
MMMGEQMRRARNDCAAEETDLPALHALLAAEPQIVPRVQGSRAFMRHRRIDHACASQISSKRTAKRKTSGRALPEVSEI